MDCKENTEDFKIKRIFRDIVNEKRQDKLKDITTTELIDELISRLDAPIFGLCVLCDFQKDSGYFNLENYSEKTKTNLFCNNCIIKIMK